jgi:hypothetical protein
MNFDSKELLAIGTFCSMDFTSSRWLPIVRLTAANPFLPFAWAAGPTAPAPAARQKIARSRMFRHVPAAPFGLEILLHINPQLKLRAIFGRRSATENRHVPI